jgi:hypothetical protein
MLSRFRRLNTKYSEGTFLAISLTGLLFASLIYSVLFSPEISAIFVGGFFGLLVLGWSIRKVLGYLGNDASSSTPLSLIELQKAQSRLEADIQTLKSDLSSAGI